MYWEFVAKYLIYFYFILGGWILLFYSFQTLIISILSILFTLIGVVAVKQLTDLPRPYIRKGLKAKISPAPTDSSFPSGHTASSMSLATSLLLVNPYLGMISVLMALLLGLSRIRVLVHTKTDVMVGAFLGISLTLIFNYLFYNLLFR